MSENDHPATHRCTMIHTTRTPTAPYHDRPAAQLPSTSTSPLQTRDPDDKYKHDGITHDADSRPTLDARDPDDGRKTSRSARQAYRPRLRGLARSGVTRGGGEMERGRAAKQDVPPLHNQWENRRRRAKANEERKWRRSTYIRICSGSYLFFRREGWMKEFLKRLDFDTKLAIQGSAQALGARRKAPAVTDQAPAAPRFTVPKLELQDRAETAQTLRERQVLRVECRESDQKA
ncbi:hypothetical protein B0H16DRAFT_1687896 [Mycena metata]|uniref:Uncharacterized protein n=1 Tax=Mycena metata TaxID=1033252 RepID=A0AAD7JGK9_9AGAR|nr:hypothetical protein B0H16DRAFT_1687896 [Mycena metata]